MKLAIGLVSFIPFSHLELALIGMDLGHARAPVTIFATLHFKRPPRMAARKVRIRVLVNRGMMISITIWIIPTTRGKFNTKKFLSNGLIYFFTISHHPSARYKMRHDHHDWGFLFLTSSYLSWMCSLVANHSDTISISYVFFSFPRNKDHKTKQSLTLSYNHFTPYQKKRIYDLWSQFRAGK